MKNTRWWALPLLAMLLFFPALVAGQDVVFPSREISRKAAIREVERQTGYSVAVDWGDTDVEKRVLFSANGLSLKNVLDEALAGTGMTWQIVGTTVVITAAAPTENHPVYSAIDRYSLPENLRVVPDPRSSRQVSPQQIAHIANGNWNSDGQARDSIGLVVINFRVNNTVVDEYYMDNARALGVIFNTFSNKEMLAEMDFITITAAASPEGNTAHNEQLASRRAMAIKEYIMRKYPFMNRERIFTFSIGEDWSGLHKMVREDYYVPNRAEVLSILDCDPCGSDHKRDQLKRLGDGSAWRYISANMLPYLRGGAACMIYYKQEPQPTEIKVFETDTVYVDRPVVTERIIEIPATYDGQGDPYYWAVKSNALYDLALLPDLHLEFSLGRRYSVEFGGQWSWWTKNKDNVDCWRIQVAGVEARRWLGDRLGRTPLSGHFVGVYGMAGTYDIRFGGKQGYLSDMSYSAGLSYGYSARLGRSWNLELGLSVGYVGGEYETYHYYDAANDEFYRDGRFNRNYFGPTKLRVAFSFLPGGKNPAKEKK